MSRPSSPSSNRASTPASNRGPLIVGGVAAGLVVVIILVVVLLSGGDDNGGSGGGGGGTAIQETAAVKVTGDALPRYPETSSGVITGQADQATGATIPTIEGQSFDGAPVRIGPADGAQVIMGVAHWCSHCQSEVPQVVKWLSKEPLPQGVRLATVSTAVSPDRPNHPPSRWLANEKWTAPTIADSDKYEAYTALGGGGFPYFVFVDSKGTVVARATGELDEQTFRAQVAGITP